MYDVIDGGGRFVLITKNTWSVIPENDCRVNIATAMQHCVRTAVMDEQLSEPASNPQNQPKSYQYPRSRDNLRNHLHLTSTNVDRLLQYESEDEASCNTNVSHLEDITTHSDATNDIFSKPLSQSISNKPSRSHHNFGNSFNSRNTNRSAFPRSYQTVNQSEYANTNAGATQREPIESPNDGTQHDPSIWDGLQAPESIPITCITEIVSQQCH